jgi:hypothetical protein
MRHPECLHATANGSDDYSGVECCLCNGSPCDVGLTLLAAHDEFMAALDARFNGDEATA